MPPNARYLVSPVDLELRERRRRVARAEGRRRALVALVLVVLCHLVGVPLFALVFTRPGRPIEEPKAELVRIPAAQWDSAFSTANQAKKTPRLPGLELPEAEEPKPPELEEKQPEEEKPEKMPGQVVETAPGNGEVDPNAKLAAESSNRVEHETIARDRAPGHDVTMPRETAPGKPKLDGPAPSPAERGKQGDGLSIGEAGEGEDEHKGDAGTHLEVPSIEQRDRVAMKEAPDGAGGYRTQDESEALEGNSDRLRIEVGEGDGKDLADGAGAPVGQGGPLKLFPSAATVDRIAGGASPDHVEGMEEGDGTFLNTREWRYASFFNRIKDSVGVQWHPGDEIRRRDPTGEVYAWKDRHTLLSVTLDADGRVADISVARSSGVDFLDREAMAAFERAQPFPNPPRGLADADGHIQFEFGFFLEVGTRGLRIFR